MSINKNKRVLKWEIDITSKEPHLIGAGPVVQVAVQHDPSIVTVWTEESIPRRPSQRQVMIYGTGFEVPGHAKHLGSCITASGTLVWHVYDVTPPVTRS